MRRLSAITLLTLAAVQFGCASPATTDETIPSAGALAKILGNAPGGNLAVKSQDETGAALAAAFDNGIYRLGAHRNITAVLFDGPPDNPRQAVTIRVFWHPRAGRTPIDPTATNATIHYIIFADDERERVGIYSGAGFVFPNNKVGGKTLTAAVWEASLRLTNHTDTFNDLLGQALLEGKFKVRRDDVALDLAIRRLNVRIRQALGYPRLVTAE